MRDRNVLKSPDLRKFLDIAEKDAIKRGLLIEVSGVGEAIERADINAFGDALLEISNKLQSVLADVIELQNYFKGE